jgi:imidazoleglycerol phosphate dehydratase HisB
MFLKISVKKVQVSLKSDKNNVRIFYTKTNIQFLSHVAQFFLEWKMFQAKVAEKIKKNIFNKSPPPPRK